MVNRIALALSLVLVACGPADMPEYDSVTSQSDAPEPPVETCGMVFSPVPELLEATGVAAARWSAATGCDVRVGDGGVPVSEKTDLRDNEGAVIYGKASVILTADTREYVGCAGIVLSATRGHSTLVHEMGHCLGAVGHTDGGVIDDHSNGSMSITAPDLSLVCENLDCAGFSPEI
jgi:hypothetical protein